MNHLLKRSMALALCVTLFGTQSPIAACAAQESTISAKVFSEEASVTTEEITVEEDIGSESQTEEISSETVEKTEEPTVSSTESKEAAINSSETVTDTDNDDGNNSKSSTQNEGTTSKSTKKKKKSSSEKGDSKDNTLSKDETAKEIKQLDDTVIDEEDSAEKDTEPEAIIPKIYGTSEIITKDNAEYMGTYIYFNQTDSAWNQNGYQIASAGCGPTSMAIVISSLTDKWVTPIDTAVWGYEHGYYSSAGSAHEMIPAMAEAYGLKCKGVGTDYTSIKKALKKNKPVVALMGPGYFTRKGHFMVLIDIDKNDNVTVADVASRTRSSYKYALSDIISQSKSASAGGPFWVISKPKKKTNENTDVSASVSSSPKTDYSLCVKDETTVKYITYQLGDKVSYHGTTGIIVEFDRNRAYVKGDDGTFLKNIESDTKKSIRLSELVILQQAPPSIRKAITKSIMS